MESSVHCCSKTPRLGFSLTQPKAKMSISGNIPDAEFEVMIREALATHFGNTVDVKIYI